MSDEIGATSLLSLGFPEHFHGKFAFEYGIDRKGRSPSLGDLQYLANRVSFHKNTATFAARYLQWKQGRRTSSNSTTEAFQRVEELCGRLPGIEEPTEWYAADLVPAADEFRRILREFEPLKAAPSGEGWENIEVEVRSVYRENPLWAECLAVASGIALCLFAISIGASYLLQTISSTRRNQDLANYMKDGRKMLERQIRSEGRWTPQHTEALRELNKVADLLVASSKPGSAGFRFRVGRQEIDAQGHVGGPPNGGNSGSGRSAIGPRRRRLEIPDEPPPADNPG